LVGQFIAGRRDDFVLATKFTLGLKQDSKLLAVGNNRKNMIRSVEASLE
jgi:aryl-alcohol dehydrogenase-like predicted oxidoreductase